MSHSLSQCQGYLCLKCLSHQLPSSCVFLTFYNGQFYLIIYLLNNEVLSACYLSDLFLGTRGLAGNKIGNNFYLDIHNFLGFRDFV